MKICWQTSHISSPKGTEGLGSLSTVFPPLSSVPSSHPSVSCEYQSLDPFDSSWAKCPVQLVRLVSASPVILDYAHHWNHLFRFRYDGYFVSPPSLLSRKSTYSPCFLLHSLPIQLYLVDTFQFAASSLAAASVFRSFFGFAFPLFGEQMFAALGYGGGNSLLAGLAIVIGIPFPIWLYFKGEQMRMNSKYARHD